MPELDQIGNRIVGEKLVDAPHADQMGTDDGAHVAQDHVGHTVVGRDDPKGQVILFALHIKLTGWHAQTFGKGVIRFDIAAMPAHIGDMGDGAHEQRPAYPAKRSG